MTNNQTNGIPQGSVLMDFIAEIVLGYADLLLTQKLNDNGIEDYKIITNYLYIEHLTGDLFINNKLIDLVSYNTHLKYAPLNPNKEAVEYLETKTNNKIKYCISEQENKEILKTCKKIKLHTIIPTIILDKEPTRVVKENLKNGIIIGVKVTTQVRNELDYIMKYVKSKGYSIKNLEKLLEE